MGKSRHRRNASKVRRAAAPRSPKPVDLRLVTSMQRGDPELLKAAPTCPGGSRPGVDGEVILALTHVDALVREMRVDVSYPMGAWDENSAVQRYLMYLSLLVDIVLADISMSAIHANDMMVLMKMRMLVEYAVKAMYFDDHPDYALHQMTIGEAEEVLKKVRNAGSPDDEIERAQKQLDAMRAQFPSVQHISKKRVAEIVREVAGRDEQVWLYAAPSALLHGDPEGLRQMMSTDESGNAVPRILLPMPALNALLVDSGTNTLAFCERFIRRFHPDGTPLTDRLSYLKQWFHELILRHDHGRDAEPLKTIQIELDALRNEPGLPIHGVLTVTAS